jgi:CheY-like chemotaxis protein
MTDSPTAAVPRRSTILLLEQDQGARSKYALLLQAHGYQVQSTGNEAEAQQLCAAAPPDLVLVGCDDRSQASWALCERLRRGNPKQRIALLHRDTLHLCPLFFNGNLLLKGEVPKDFLGRVEALLLAS